MSEQSPLSWPKYLDDAAHALNTAVHATTGAQPYFAFFSRHMRRYVGVPLPTTQWAGTLLMTEYLKFEIFIFLALEYL